MSKGHDTFSYRNTCKCTSNKVSIIFSVHYTITVIDAPKAFIIASDPDLNEILVPKVSSFNDTREVYTREVSLREFPRPSCNIYYAVPFWVTCTVNPLINLQVTCTTSLHNPNLLWILDIQYISPSESVLSAKSQKTHGSLSNAWRVLQVSMSTVDAQSHQLCRVDTIKYSCEF